MLKKIVFKVLFERKRIIVAFTLICCLLVIYISLQTIFETENITSLNTMPDFVFTGTYYNSEDGTYPFKAYNGIGSFAEKAKETLGNNGDCYGIVCRSLYNYYDELTSVGFSGYIYGCPDEYIKYRFSNLVTEGSLPVSGKKEAIVGYYFAQRFGLSIGDPIPQTITLNETWSDSDNNQYTISGILGEGMCSYFNGSVIISKDTFEAVVGVNEDNLIFGYFINGENSDKIFLKLNNISADYRSPEGTLHYNQKNFQIKKIWVNVVMYLMISTLIIFISTSYLMKGLTPKIGLLKAIGLSNKYIYKAFLGGVAFFVIISTAMGFIFSFLITRVLNSYVSNFYGFEVHMYNFSLTVYILVAAETLLMFFVIFLFLFINSKKISPKIAMMKKDC